MSNEIIFDRSRHEAYEKCPRKRFLEYELPMQFVQVDVLPNGDEEGGVYEARGISKRNVAVPLLSGSMVHKVAEFFLNGYGEDAAIASGLAAYDEEVTTRGIELDELAPEPTWVIKVQRALVEALGRGWIRYVYPKFAAEFKVLMVEQEMRAAFVVGRKAVNIGLRDRGKFEFGTDEFSDETVTLMARADLIVERISDGRLFVRNFKTINEASAKKRAALRYDAQNISEVLATEQHTARDIDGVLYDLLVKGPRKAQYPPKSGVWHNTSPLIWCYVKTGQEGVTEDEIACRWEYTCTGPHTMANHHKCPGEREHKLGKGWNRKLVTDYFQNGLLDWFGWLEENDPELIREQFVQLDPVMRSPFDVETWKRSVLAEEKRIAEDADFVRQQMAGADLDLQSAFPILDTYFPKHTAHGNCLWPSECPMFQICWGTAAVDLFENGFAPRIPNHPEGQPEVEEVAE